MSTFLGLDYPTLFFLIVGAIFSGYAILDGFDLGAGALHLFFRKDLSRRIALNAIGPVWDGNEVWLVIGGGVLFAAFPVFYGTLLSAMYIPFMLFLFFIILRAIAIEFRSKEEMAWWRQLWDVTYSGSSIMIAMCLGIVLGNVLQGMPLDANHEYIGTWYAFFNIYAILTGLTTVALMAVHGGIYLCIKTEGKLFERVEGKLKQTVIAFIILFSLLSFYSLIFFPHLSNKFKEYPVLFLVPLCAVLSIANIPRLIHKQKFISAFIFSSLTFSFLLMIVFIESYPQLLIATNNIDYSLNIYNSSASDKSMGCLNLWL